MHKAFSHVAARVEFTNPGLFDPSVQHQQVATENLKANPIESHPADGLCREHSDQPRKQNPATIKLKLLRMLAFAFGLRLGFSSGLCRGSLGRGRLCFCTLTPSAGDDFWKNFLAFLRAQKFFRVQKQLLSWSRVLLMIVRPDFQLSCRGPR